MTLVEKRWVGRRPRVLRSVGRRLGAPGETFTVYPGGVSTGLTVDGSTTLQTFVDFVLSHVGPGSSDPKIAIELMPDIGKVVFAWENETTGKIPIDSTIGDLAKIFA